jgi:hypothetical protein
LLANESTLSKSGPLKAIAGVGFWIALLIALFAWTNRGAGGNQERFRSLWNFVAGSRQKVVLKLSQLELMQVGDQIFLPGTSGSPAIGRITRVESPTSQNMDLTYADYAEAEFYGSAPSLVDGAYLTLHQGPNSMAWVVETMLSPNIRSEILQLLRTAFEEHQTEIVQELQPLLLESLRRSSEVLREDFQKAFAARSAELRAISDRYEEEFVRSKLTPLLREQVWPIIQREAEPLANQIGQQLWDQASLWRLTWRILYDASPLPERDLTRKEFRRFVDNHVLPTLESHLPDFLELQKRIITEILANQEFRDTIRSGAEQIALDRELQSQLFGILNDVITDNPRLKQVWRDVWSTPEAQAALSDANSRLEPTITAIGETMFGNPRKRITPEFSQVLRNRVLFKDQRWLVLQLPKDGEQKSSSRARELNVINGDSNAPNPFHIPARSRQ